MQVEEPLVLIVAEDNGKVAREEVLVVRLGAGVFRLAKSPGLASGIAAGDTIGVKERAGNLCIQVFCNKPGD